MKNIPFLSLFSFALLLTITGYGQKKEPVVKCANETLLKKYLKRGPTAIKKFHDTEARLAKEAKAILKRRQFSREQAIITVPVVFHIVLPNPSLVTDADIAAQMQVLNTDFAGTNSDTTNLPAAFKAVFAHTNIRFCMAQRTPDQEPTTGIERITSGVSSNPAPGDPVKHKNKGGADSWDPTKYLNVWIVRIPGGVLGYGKIPGINYIPDTEDGVVISYQTLPGSTGVAPYNLGRTAVHEVGHYFRLLHIWGDDNGTCAGSDFPDDPLLDDTPNQAKETIGCPSGIVVDSCSPVSPGIMYENYMDYTDDACMALFTKGQSIRMEAAIFLYRPALITSDGCAPVALFSRNVKAQQITSPVASVCSGNIQPALKIKNLGSTTLTSLQITANVDNGAITGITNWTGNLASLSETTITLNSISGLIPGKHNLTVYTSLPNGAPDQFVQNDTAKSSFVYQGAISGNLKEGFEGPIFPPQGWAIDNPDNSITWDTTSAAAKTGVKSVWMNNFDYPVANEKDYLISPIFPVNNADSTFLTFQLAAVTFSSPSSPGIEFDTLEVLVTGDCGATYKSVYKKAGASLITSPTKTDGYQNEFVPTANEWRKDSVYLTPYVTGYNNFQVVFKNVANYENNIYLDDINLYNYYINPILKEKGLLITPNPFRQSFYVQHYPPPANLQAICVYNTLGQLIMQRSFAGSPAPNFIEFNLGGHQTGMYYVKVIYSNKTITQKILKTN
ncbi:MAG: T9SS type A sorting domain-containing protein [Sphingobacteriales bacterium]|nr:MAG: T9SS type A sorting domain-containing protein [Sphingobacteriales bacterium]